MSTGWLWLLAAGVVEIAWAQSIPPTQGFTRPWPSAICLALCVAVIYLLAMASKTVPLSTAYVVFTGMGAIGAVALGLALHHDRLTPGRLLAVGLIVGGVVLAHATTEHA
ncbi:DMT family transporter [Pseudonocardia spinosispora]|uniref:DMT family transporter n=1 Tax=Pseudonocardia spinosispora TaxID=103441 RepID=UPI00041BD15C|nr:multidrug efflux SMR transporter [Pseudonocardia spinosispora]